MPKDNPTPVKTIQQLLDPTAKPFGGKYGQDNDSYVFDESRVTVSLLVHKYLNLKTDIQIC